MYKSLNAVVVGWKEIYQNKQKEKKYHGGGEREKRKSGRVEGWVLVEGCMHGGVQREPRATRVERAEHSLLGES